MIIQKEIFGKSIKIQFSGNRLEEIFKKELSLYKDTTNKESLLIKISSAPLQNISEYYISQNPSIIKFGVHKNKNNSSFFSFSFGRYWKTQLTYFFTDWQLTEILVTLPPFSEIKLLIEKVLWMQFLHYKEYFWQVLHELVLIPSTYFFTDLSLIHGSSLKLKWKWIIISWTWWVGKTSLELYFLQKYKASFIADDISILNNETSTLYLNANRPKIYGYNLQWNIILYKRVFQKRTLLDRFFWNVHYKFRGPHRVRRRVSPTLLANGVSHTAKLSHFFILNKTNKVNYPTIEEFSSQAKKITESILSAEYYEFERFFNWFLVNQLMNKSRKTIIPENSPSIKGKIFIVNIPLGHSNHFDTIEQIADLIYQSL